MPGSLSRTTDPAPACYRRGRYASGCAACAGRHAARAATGPANAANLGHTREKPWAACARKDSKSKSSSENLRGEG